MNSMPQDLKCNTFDFFTINLVTIIKLEMYIFIFITQKQIILCFYKRTFCVFYYY